MSSLRRPTSSLFVTAFLLFLAPAVASAQGFKLNAPLTRDTGGGVFSPRIDPSGAWVVYSAPQDSQVPRLFSARIDGTGGPLPLSSEGLTFAVVQLGRDGTVLFNDFRGDPTVYRVPIDGSRSPELVLSLEPGRGFAGFRLAPDGKHLVYSTYTDSNNGPFELFSVEVDLGKRPTLLVSPTSLSTFQLSPDGSRVVYDGGLELYSVPIDGSAASVKLSGPMAPGGHLASNFSLPPFRISPDGSRVVYLADQDVDERFEVYSVPIDGHSAPVKLNGALVTNGDVQRYDISLDGRRVVYRADQARNNQDELYSVPIDGSQAPVKLNGVFANADDVYEYQLSPDGARVVYAARSRRELYSAPIDGSLPEVKLDGPAPIPSIPFLFAAGGERVVYLGTTDTDLYSVPIAGAAGTRLTQTIAPALGPDYRFVVTPDGSRVVYLDELDSSRNFVLRTVPVDGQSQPATLAGPFGPLTYWFTLQVGADAAHALLLADLNRPGVNELFSAPLAGGDLVRLNGPLITRVVTGDVTSLELAPDGERCAFASYGTDNESSYGEVHSVPIRPHSRSVDLLDGVPSRSYSGRFVSEQRFSPDGSRVVYAFGENEGGFDLFSAPADGGLAPVRLNDPNTSSDGVGQFRISPDGRTVVFSSYQGYSSELYAAPIAGGPEVELSGDLPENAYVTCFEVTASGDRVVYAADQRTAGVYELFSVPIDGSSTPVVLGGAGTSGPPPEFQLTADGARVVYRIDQERDEVFELYVAPTDGSAPWMKIGVPLPDTGDVLAGFRLSPDGTRVVYRADARRDEVFELWSAPLDRSMRAMRLSDRLVAGGDVQAEFEISPDGARVVYRADQLGDELFELFSVPLDGSSPPVRLNPRLVAGGDVRSDDRDPRYGTQSPFLVSPDGQRVVYRADQYRDEVFELFSVPITGGRAIAVSGPLVAGGDVLEGFRITPDSTQVVYGADQDADQVFELYAAPLDRAQAAHNLNPPLVSGGDAAVISRYFGPAAPPLPVFAISADGSRVVYLADQDTDDVFELYLSYLERPEHLPLPADPPRNP
jgi:Tol biopolymer transport system component